MKRAIVTGGTKLDIAPMAVFVINVAETNPDLFDEVVIFHDGIKEKDQKLINDIYPTRFIEYAYPYKSSNDVVLSYFSPMLFCKYECFGLLKNYDEVLWSDYDVVILGKLDEICNVSGKNVKAIFPDEPLRNMFYKDVVNKEIFDYDLERPGMTTAFFTLSKDITDHDKILKWCYEKTSLWDKDIYYAEQCVFSLALQEFDLNCIDYPFDKYACYPTKAVGDEVIIHAAGQPKFWNGLKNEKWDRMYERWIKMGGTPYSDLKKKINRKYHLLMTRLRGIKHRTNQSV